MHILFYTPVLQPRIEWLWRSNISAILSERGHTYAYAPYEGYKNIHEFFKKHPYYENPCDIIVALDTRMPHWKYIQGTAKKYGCKIVWQGEAYNNQVGGFPDYVLGWGPVANDTFPSGVGSIGRRSFPSNRIEITGTPKYDPFATPKLRDITRDHIEIADDRILVCAASGFDQPSTQSLAHVKKWTSDLFHSLAEFGGRYHVTFKKKATANMKLWKPAYDIAETLSHKLDITYNIMCTRNRDKERKAIDCGDLLSATDILYCDVSSTLYEGMYFDLTPISYVADELRPLLKARRFGPGTIWGKKEFELQDNDVMLRCHDKESLLTQLDRSIKDNHSPNKHRDDCVYYHLYHRDGKAGERIVNFLEKVGNG